MLEIKIPLRTKVVLAGISVMILIVSAVVLWNAFRLRTEIGEQTKRYVSDITVQLTKDIDNRLSRVVVELEAIGDTLSRNDFYRSDPDRLQEYLERKVQTFGFTSIVILKADGTAYQSHSSAEEFNSLPGVQASFSGENSVSFLDEQSILYTIPIWQDGRVVGVLGGVRDKENMQALIQMDSFSGEGLTCIVNCNGEVIISPTELSPFMQLDDLFSKDPEGTAAQHIYQMKEDMLAHQAGIFRFGAIDGTDLILAYNPLDSYDWVLLTLAPSNIISEDIDQYMGETFVIVTGAVLLMAIVLVVLILSQKTHYQEMEQLAFVDRLTGAMNNAAFQTKCEALFPRALPNTYSVVYLDIKNFKLFNKQFGSEQGNDVLRKIMKVLEESSGENGFAARAEADTFYLCLAEGDPERILQTVNGILADITREVKRINQIKNLQLYFVLQSGVCIVDDPSLNIMTVLDRAKIACRNRISSEDGVCKFYDTAVMVQLERDQELNGLFENSLANADFQVYLQPKVWAGNGMVGGAEALVRWQHPQKGMIYPSDFIPLFESNGNICKLDLYVFEEVCKTIRRWQSTGKPLFPISVNFSRQHFQRADCLRPFAEIAERYQIPEHMIELELTESIIFDDQTIEMVKSCIDEMHKMGFLCSLDDFGSGYSSLGLLTEFNVDAIKMDRRFFKNMESAKAKAMIALVVEFSRTLGALTVAEGIETPEQLAILQDIHCDMVQGYVYAKPMPIPEFEDWIKAHEPAGC